MSEMKGVWCPVASRLLPSHRLPSGRHAQRSRPVLFPAFPFHLPTSLTPHSQIAQLQRCEPITEEQVKQLCLKAREILIEEGNVQVVDSPVTVRFPPPSLLWVSRPPTTS